MINHESTKRTHQVATAIAVASRHHDQRCRKGCWPTTRRNGSSRTTLWKLTRQGRLDCCVEDTVEWVWRTKLDGTFLQLKPDLKPATPPQLSPFDKNRGCTSQLCLDFESRRTGVEDVSDDGRTGYAVSQSLGVPATEQYGTHSLISLLPCSNLDHTWFLRLSIAGTAGESFYATSWIGPARGSTPEEIRGMQITPLFK